MTFGIGLLSLVMRATSRTSAAGAIAFFVGFKTLAALEKQNVLGGNLPAILNSAFFFAIAFVAVVGVPELRETLRRTRERGSLFALSKDDFTRFYRPACLRMAVFFVVICFMFILSEVSGFVFSA